MIDHILIYFVVVVLFRLLPLSGDLFRDCSVTAQAATEQLQKMQQEMGLMGGVVKDRDLPPDSGLDSQWHNSFV